MSSIKNKVLLMTIFIYTILSIFLLIQNAVLYTNIINPLFWSAIIVLLIIYIKRYYIKCPKNRSYFKYLFFILTIQTIIYFYIGLIYGFAKSPYNHELISIIKNIITHVIPILGMELSRNILLTRNNNNKLIISITTLLFILLEIKFNILINLFKYKEDLFKYIFSNIIPTIASNCLYSFFYLKGLFYMTLIYRTFNILSILLLPILPDVDWFIYGSMKIVYIVIVYALFKYIFLKEKRSYRKKENITSVKISYIISLTISITLICFMIGIFDYEPISILSNSMSPTYARGDVLIFKKLTLNELEKIPINSIIVYTVRNQNIAHRVVDIVEKNNTILYRTKGDNNNVADKELVTVKQIQGIYIFHIKYIGFPSVWLHDYFKEENAKLQMM